MTRGFVRFVRANTIALLALFIALSGTTYAATETNRPRNLKANTLNFTAIPITATIGAHSFRSRLFQPGSGWIGS